MRKGSPGIYVPLRSCLRNTLVRRHRTWYLRSLKGFLWCVGYGNDSQEERFRSSRKRTDLGKITNYEWPVDCMLIRTRNLFGFPVVEVTSWVKTSVGTEVFMWKWIPVLEVFPLSDTSTVKSEVRRTDVVSSIPGFTFHYFGSGYWLCL